MRCIRLFLFFFMMAIATFSAPMSYAQDTITSRLEAFEKAGDRLAVFDTALNPASQDEFMAALDFMKGRVMGGAYDAGYFTTYAQLLWHAEVKDTAAAMATASLLLLYTDRARCVDKTAGQTRIQNTFDALKPMLEYLRGLEKREKGKVLDIASSLENRLDRRPPNRSLCYSGVEATGKVVAMIESGEVIAQKDDQGNILIPDIDSIEVAYIPEREWHNKRLEIRSGFPAYFE